MFTSKLKFPHHLHKPEIWSLLSVGLGVLIRLVQYLSNRSLWFDEVALSFNLLDRGYFELLNALAYNQAAPPLFLWIEKLAVNTLGSSEYSLRLFPLMGGLVSLGLFYCLTQQWTNGWARPIAIFLFAIQGYIVYFANEVKPYSWDVAIALLLFMAITGLAAIKPTFKQQLTAALVGIVSIWLSFPSIFVIAGVEAVNIIKLQLWQASRQTIKDFFIRRLPLYSAWIISFCSLYFLIIRKTLSDTGLSDSWAGRYPNNLWDISWLVDSMGRFFYRPLGFHGPADGVAIVAFITGCILLYRTAKLRLLYLSSPLLVTLLAAFLHKYPFRDRLILFLTPFTLILLSKGIDFWFTRWKKKPRILGLISFIMAITLLLMPLKRGLHGIMVPTSLHFDHVRPTIQYIDTHWQAGDKLYVLPGAQLQFEFYNRRFELPIADIVLSQLRDIGIWEVSDTDLKEHYQELRNLKTTVLKDEERVWVLLARKKSTSEDAIVEQLNRLGTLVERKQYPGAMVGLYDFSS
ncbi:MAG: hypothetical protein AAF579_02810 [Cyanobacteria bacterium P01_C01_bin.118]